MSPRPLLALAAPALALAALAIIGSLAIGGCRDTEFPPLEMPPDPAAGREGPPGALWDVVDMLRESVALKHDASDGGGRAWLEPVPGDTNPARATTPGRFTIVYEVGPHGIATGGSVFLQVSPFWGWSTPQIEAPDLPGYTVVEASADDIELASGTLDQQLLGIEVTGRPLVPGDRIRITYGAGDLGAIADRYAESGSRFWIGVDGDGDGTRSFVVDSPGVDVVAADPRRLVITVPTTARPGETVRVTLALLDTAGNAGTPVDGDIVFEEPPPEIRLPERVTLTPADAGRTVIQAVVGEPGIYRLRATGPGGLSGESNPLVVSEDGPRVLWADLHGHSNLSDGTATPEEYFLYARDVAALDVAALTDHDHWGILPLDAHPAMWEDIVSQTRRFHEPGRFVTLLGYEWTSWIYGHRHVLYFEDEGEVFSSVDEEYESPQQLWKALEGRPALTFAHHSAGGPVPNDWDVEPDPIFEPVTEIVSVHGSSEALDSPIVIYDAVEGNFVRDALDRGYRLGFVGSGDSHDGHPGLAQLASSSGGLAAILAEELTREAVLAALRARRVYATSGPRILLRMALGAHPMGSTLELGEQESTSEELFVRVVAHAPLDRVDLIRSGSVVDSIETDGRLDLALQRTVDNLRTGEYVYVRAIQENGFAAWSSPVFIE